jgi:hypothetical protein
MLFLLPVTGLTQEVQPQEEETTEEQTAEQAQPAPADEGGVIELGVTEIKVTVEKPQVLLFSNRIKPEFDEVNLEKSFMNEIVGESERFVFDFSDSKKPVERIDVNKLVNQYR